MPSSNEKAWGPDHGLQYYFPTKGTSIPWKWLILESGQEIHKMSLEDTTLSLSFWWGYVQETQEATEKAPDGQSWNHLSNTLNSVFPKVEKKYLYEFILYILLNIRVYGREKMNLPYRRIPKDSHSLCVGYT